MLRFRLIMCAVGTLVFWALRSLILHGPQIVRNNGEGFVVFGFLFLSIMLLAAAEILFFSFFLVSTTPDGQPCFNPRNLHWRLMKKFWGPFWGSQISTCKNYWLTVMTITIGAFALLMVMCATASALGAIRKVSASPNKMLPEFGMFAGIGLLCILTLVVCFRLTGKFPKLKYLWGVLGALGLIGVLVILPIGLIREERKISVSAASGTYILWVLGSALAIAAVILLVWAAFKCIPVLRNTWLGQLFGLVKKNFCPTLVACPVPCDK